MVKARYRTSRNIVIMFYYAIMAAKQNNTVQYTHANTFTEKTQTDKNSKKGTELIKHARRLHRTRMWKNSLARPSSAARRQFSVAV